MLAKLLTFQRGKSNKKACSEINYSTCGPQQHQSIRQGKGEICYQLPLSTNCLVFINNNGEPTTVMEYHVNVLAEKHTEEKRRRRGARGKNRRTGTNRPSSSGGQILSDTQIKTSPFPQPLVQHVSSECQMMFFLYVERLPRNHHIIPSRSSLNCRTPQAFPRHPSVSGWFRK